MDIGTRTVLQHCLEFPELTKTKKLNTTEMTINSNLNKLWHIDILYGIVTTKDK